jgi:stage V sporulation protein AC
LLKVHNTAEVVKLDNNALKQAQIAEYDALVKQIKPRPPFLKNCLWAFVVGGIICVLGQLIVNYSLSAGMEKTDAYSVASVVMIFLGSLLTGLGKYDELGKRAGAGSIVPITGFANSIVASAMEFKREGYIFGVGARIFTVAGPTLVFGFAISVFVGLIKVLLQ